MFIRSERLFLRPGWAEDWPELEQRFGDESVARTLARVPWPLRAEDNSGPAADPRCPHFLITLPSAAGPAPIIGCIGLVRGEDGVELGFWITRPHRGQGHATEAVRAVLRLAQVLGHRQLLAGHFVDNPAGAAVLRKAGFTATGRLRQRYSLARGYQAQWVEHRAELAPPCDCDAGEDCVEAMRAA